jgi:hypothetical protein
MAILPPFKLASRVPEPGCRDLRSGSGGTARAEVVRSVGRIGLGVRHTRKPEAVALLFQREPVS